MAGDVPYVKDEFLSTALFGFNFGFNCNLHVVDGFIGQAIVVPHVYGDNKVR